MVQPATGQNKLLEASSSVWQLRTCLLVFGLIVGWTFWPTIAELGQKWLHDPQYSHGLLVPAFAFYLLWTRRQMLAHVGPPGVAAGIACLLLAAVFRVISGIFCFEWIDAVALLP